MTINDNDYETDVPFLLCVSGAVSVFYVLCFWRKNDRQQERPLRETREKRAHTRSRWHFSVYETETLHSLSWLGASGKSWVSGISLGVLPYERIKKRSTKYCSITFLHWLFNLTLLFSQSFFGLEGESVNMRYAVLTLSITSDICFALVDATITKKKNTTI